MKITAKSTLKSIKDAMMDDFNVVIDDAEAKEIREGGRCNTITWTRERFVNVALSARIRQVDVCGVRYGTAFYTTVEWNQNATS